MLHDNIRYHARFNYLDCCARRAVVRKVTTVVLTHPREPSHDFAFNISFWCQPKLAHIAKSRQASIFRTRNCRRVRFACVLLCIFMTKILAQMDATFAASPRHHSGFATPRRRLWQTFDPPRPRSLEINLLLVPAPRREGSSVGASEHLPRSLIHDLRNHVS